MTDQQLADEWGKSLRQVRNREAQGVVVRGPDGLFDLTVSLTALRAASNGGGRPRNGAGTSPEKRAADGVDWSLALKREQARKAKIERLELQGRLVRRGTVERTWAEQATMVRDQLLQLGPRLAGRLAAETDPRVCSQLVTDEVTVALRALADEV